MGQKGRTCLSHRSPKDLLEEAARWGQLYRLTGPYNEFLRTIHSQQTAGFILVAGGHGTDAGADGFAGQIEVLADMAGIESGGQKL